MEDVLQQFEQGGDLKRNLQDIASINYKCRDHAVVTFIRAIADCTKPVDEEAEIVRQDTAVLLSQLGGLAQLSDSQIAVAGLVCLIPNFKVHLKNNKICDDFVSMASSAKALLAQATAFKDQWKVSMPQSYFKDLLPENFSIKVASFVRNVDVGSRLLQLLLEHVGSALSSQVHIAVEEAGSCFDKDGVATCFLDVLQSYLPCSVV